MAMVRRGSARIVRRDGNTLRPVEWIRKAEFDLPVSEPAGTLVFVLVTDPEFDEFTRPTVVRVRLSLISRITDITLGAQAVVNFGLTMVNPGEPPPDPAGQVGGNRWLWWHQTRLENPPGATAVEFADGISWQRELVDIKSMRKRLVDGSTLQLAIRVQGSAVCSFDMGSSVLVKE